MDVHVSPDHQASSIAKIKRENKNQKQKQKQKRKQKRKEKGERKEKKREKETGKKRLTGLAHTTREGVRRGHVPIWLAYRSRRSKKPKRILKERKKAKSPRELNTTGMVSLLPNLRLCQKTYGVVIIYQVLASPKKIKIWPMFGLLQEIICQCTLRPHIYILHLSQNNITMRAMREHV
jgi:hypothetical protein